MFKKKKLEVRLTDADPKEETIWQEHVDPEAVVQIVRETTNVIVTGIVAVLGTSFVLRTAEHLIVNTVKAIAK